MGVKVYGRSDAENELIQFLEGNFQEIKISSLDEYQEFSRYPEQFRKKMIDDCDAKIQKSNKKLKELKLYNNKIENEIEDKKSSIYRKIKTRKMVYGQLKYKIQEEIKDLKEKKDELEEKLKVTNNRIFNTEEDLKTLITRKKELAKNLDFDIKKLLELQEDFHFKNILKGAWGEKEVIELIKESFDGEKNYHLINAFNIDLLGKAINFNDKILTENKIDHVLLCPKGLYILETKAWNVVTEEAKKEVENQLNKSRKVFETLFDSKINENTNYVVVTTKKPIEVNGSSCRSVSLQEFTSFIKSSNHSLPKDDINLILEKLLPYLKENHVRKFDKGEIIIKANIAKGKKFVKGWFKSPKSVKPNPKRL
jgi:hypothetical protein